MAIRCIHANLLPVLLWATFSATAYAEKADRDKPILIEGGRCQGDLRTGRSVCRGDVVVTQGTFVLHTSRLDISQDAEGYQAAIANGGRNGLADFRQKKDGRDEYIKGEATRIEFDGRTDKVKLFRRAFFLNGLNEARGEYMEYDGYNEQLVVDSDRKGDRRMTLMLMPGKHAPTTAASGPANEP